MIPETIVAATDFSPHGAAAVDWAATLACALGAKLVIVNVYDILLAGFPDASILASATTASRSSDVAQAALDKEVQRVRESTPRVEGALKQGDAREAVPAFAAEIGAGLLVVGSHGRRGLARALIGSVAEGIVRTSTIPVVVVRNGEAAT
jgi:nucleotide-binding universal stress UspA family protein